jgi:PLD-like domain
MGFRLVDAGWDEELREGLRVDSSEIRIVCPFIKKRVAARLLEHGKPKVLQVITRFNLGDFCSCVSDIGALELLLENGAEIRGVRNLHAKLYLFGRKQVIVTSANLTEAALLRNHEFGFVAQDAAIVSRCGQYFDELWKRAGQDLSAVRLADWQRKLTSYFASGGSRPTVPFGDEGVNAGLCNESIALPAWVGDADQAFVKFFGESENRASRSLPILDEVKRSGCHWACTYPKGKRPRQVSDNAIIFVSRLVQNPNDILVYGRAVAMQHQPGRDDATAAEIHKGRGKKSGPTTCACTTLSL